jgi:hypothetical protein
MIEADRAASAFAYRVLAGHNQFSIWQGTTTAIRAPFGQTYPEDAW